MAPKSRIVRLQEEAASLRRLVETAEANHHHDLAHEYRRELYNVNELIREATQEKTRV